MTHDPREALEPCPFCGGEAQLINEGVFFSVACPHYYCNFSQIALQNKDRAVKRWNTRALTASPGVVSVELLNIERATGDRLRSENDKLRATIASPGEQKPFGWLGRDGKFSLPVEMTRERFLSHFHDMPVGTPVIPLYTSAPPAAGWDITDDMVERACKAYADATGYYVEFHRGLSSPSADGMRKGMRAALETLRRAAPPAAGVALADWSDLPKDIYVTSAKRVNAVGYDVQCCSVPMVTSPEVRYVRADMITAPPSRPDAGGVQTEYERGFEAGRKSWGEIIEQHKAYTGELEAARPDAGGGAREQLAEALAENKALRAANTQLVLAERDRIEAALSTPPAAGGVRVKPLEWSGRSSNGKIHKAYVVPMEYWAWESAGFGYWSWGALAGREVHGGLDAAKAAAQADYERRILSALSTPPAAAESDYYAIQAALSPHIASTTELMAAMSSIWPLIKSPAAAESNASVKAKEDLADWSNLPKDIYVIAAQRVNAVGFDVQCCSVPMVTAPEVRYVRADMVAKPNASAEARLREALDREESYLQSHFNHEVGGVMPSDIEGAFHRMREVLSPAAKKSEGGADFDECVASGHSCEYGPHGDDGEQQCKYCGKPSPSGPTAERREIVARTAYEAAPDLQVWREGGQPHYSWVEVKAMPGDNSAPFYAIADRILAALDGGAGA